VLSPVAGLPLVGLIDGVERRCHDLALLDRRPGVREVHGDRRVVITQEARPSLAESALQLIE